MHFKSQYKTQITMSLIDTIAGNSPITNIVDLLGLHHSNPLGIAPLWQLIFIAVVTLVMEYFLHQIRWHQKPQYYPVLYSMLGVIILGLYYYCFQSGLPTYNDVLHGGEYTSICWFCNHEIVGWGWAVVGIVLLIAISYIILCAIQQACAQITMEANPELLASKPWKELKLGVYVAMLPVLLVCIGLQVGMVATSWMFLAGSLALLAFVIVKIILDTKRTHSFLWGAFINLTFLVGIIPVCILSVGLIECAWAYIIAILALFTGAKARKKEPKKAK